MIPRIGSIIKELRKKHNLTQEELAEQLNISSQAISKWENGTSMPDISQVVPLARVLGVTTDELFGIYGTNDDEEVDKLFSEINELYMVETDNTDDIVLSKCLEAVKNHPKNMRLLSYTLGRTANKAYELQAKADPKANETYKEALRQANLIINYSKDTPQIMNARMWLVRLYCDLNEFDNAKKEAEHFSKDFECNSGIQYAWIYKLEQNCEKEIESRCNNIRELLSMLETELHFLGSAYKQLGNYGDAINTLDTVIRIAEAVYKDEDYIQPEHCSIGLFSQIAYCYICKNDTENAISYFEKEYEFIKRTDRYFNTKTWLNVPCLKKCEFKSLGTKYNDMAMLAYDMEHPYCDSIRNNERFKALYAKVVNEKEAF